MMVITKTQDNPTREMLQRTTARSLGTNTALWFKTNSFHWNVTGCDFFEYHELFGKFYTAFQCAIDIFAEQLRGLGVYAPTSLGQISELSLVQSTSIIDDGCAMIKELAKDLTAYAAHLQYNFEMAEECGEHGLGNFLAEQLDLVRKFQWFIAASLKNQN